MPLSTKDDWKATERILLKAAHEECQSFLEEARSYMKDLEGKLWMDAPSVEPRVSVHLPKPGRINLLLRIPCLTRFTLRLERTILCRFLSEFRFSDMNTDFAFFPPTPHVVYRVSGVIGEDRTMDFLYLLNGFLLIGSGGLRVFS